MNLKITNIFTLLIILLSVKVSFATEEVSIDRGTIEIFHDGVITCRAFSWSDAGGISCTKSASIDISKISNQIFKLKRGRVERLVVAGQLCYAYTWAGAGGLSCLD